jgi:hypothetical protein
MRLTTASACFTRASLWAKAALAFESSSRAMMYPDASRRDRPSVEEESLLGGIVTTGAIGAAAERVKCQAKKPTAAREAAAEIFRQRREVRGAGAGLRSIRNCRRRDDLSFATVA